MRFPHILAALVANAWAPPALADPCEGALPSTGMTFSGVVRYVGDGDGLCVGIADRPDRWIEIRLADFYAPELNDPGGIAAKRRLERIAMGKMLVCAPADAAMTASLRPAHWAVARWAPCSVPRAA